MVQEVKKIEEKLWDIDDVKIEKELSVENKVGKFSHYYLEEENLQHTNEGYVVRVHFGAKDYTATDAVKHYLKQIAQLKY